MKTVLAVIFVLGIFALFYIFTPDFLRDTFSDVRTTYNGREDNGILGRVAEFMSDSRYYPLQSLVGYSALGAFSLLMVVYWKGIRD